MPASSRTAWVGDAVELRAPAHAVAVSVAASEEHVWAVRLEGQTAVWSRRR